jgi:CcmD family protein
MPALPLDEAGKYVAAAYVVFFTLIVVYVAIISAKIARIDRELTELVEIAEKDGAAALPGDDSVAGPHGDPTADGESAPRDEEPVG